MTGDTWFGARADFNGGLKLNGVISGGYTFIMVGPGLITLGAANTWSGDTHIDGGVLRLAHTNALPNINLILGGNYTTSGGILELGTGNFSRSLGTGLNEVRFWGSGGFSAFGGDRTVTLGSGTLTWGADNFVPTGSALLLSSRYADSKVTLVNAVDLGSLQREVRAERGKNANAYGELSGKLSGDGSLLKTGPGLLHITNSANDYKGWTQIKEGALRGTVPTNSLIVLDGGVLGLDSNSTFTRGLGSNGDQIRWFGSGGFAAYGGNRIVNIGNSGATLTWGVGDFVDNDQELLFGHYTANGTVLWDNTLALGNGTRTIRVERGSNANLAVVEFRKAISGTGILNLVGTGRIDFTANNSALTLSTINIYGAELRLHGPSNRGKINASATTFNLRYGGTLTIGNRQQVGTESDRIHNDSEIRFATGSFFYKDYPGGAFNFEKVGVMEFLSGSNLIDVDYLAKGGVSLHVESFSRDTDSRATLDYRRPYFNQSGKVNFKLTHAVSGHAVNGIIPWAVQTTFDTGAEDWLTPTTESFAGPYPSIGAFTAYHTAGESGWAAAHNVRATGTVNLSDNRDINSLKLQGTLNLITHSLTLSSGGLLVTGNRTINGGTGSTITTGYDENNLRRPLYIHNSGQLTIDGSVALTGGMDVVKTRGGTLIFNSSGTHSIGSLYIHQGMLRLASGQIHTTGRVYVGDGAGWDVLDLAHDSTNLLSPNSKVTLRGSPITPTDGVWAGGEMAILRLRGNTKQALYNLHIENRGMIDFEGGETWAPNILYLDTLTFGVTAEYLSMGLGDARLFLKNWYEFEDYLLVRKNQFNSSVLSKILFEGYEDFQVLNVDYNWDYWEIKPFNSMQASPEPETYGAILGAMGLGLWAWRRWKNGRSAKTDATNQSTRQ